MSVRVLPSSPPPPWPTHHIASAATTAMPPIPKPIALTSLTRSTAPNATITTATMPIATREEPMFAAYGTRASGACASRRDIAVSMATALSSIPTKRRPSFSATASVVPLPA